MPPSREWRFRIEDIIGSIDAILDYEKGMDYQSFAADRRTRDAVVMNLAVMGEAARHVPTEIRDGHPDIPWTEMIDNRNVMVHVYFGLKSDVLWDTIWKDLPPLRDQLMRIIQ